MSNDANKQYRHSLRLCGYDYTQAGAYFVTICTQHRLCLFGDVVDSYMCFNDAGRIIDAWWSKLPSKFPSVMIDTYVIMPNHVHGIVIIGRNDANDPNNDFVVGGHTGPPLRIANHDDHRVGVDPCVHPQCIPNENDDNHRVGVDPCVHPQRIPNGDPDYTDRTPPRNPNAFPSLPMIIQWFKTMTTNAYIQGVRQQQWTSFLGRLWQRDYYERVVRNEHELNHIRDYITGNPLRWNSNQQ